LTPPLQDRGSNNHTSSQLLTHPQKRMQLRVSPDLFPTQDMDAFEAPTFVTRDRSSPSLNSKVLPN